MPNFDGTGPRGGSGRGAGRRINKRANDSRTCTCPKCGYQQAHRRGQPCNLLTCPKCQVALQGVNCYQAQ